MWCAAGKVRRWAFRYAHSTRSVFRLEFRNCSAATRPCTLTSNSTVTAINRQKLNSPHCTHPGKYFSLHHLALPFSPSSSSTISLTPLETIQDGATTNRPMRLQDRSNPRPGHLRRRQGSRPHQNGTILRMQGYLEEAHGGSRAYGSQRDRRPEARFPRSPQHRHPS